VPACQHVFFGRVPLGGACYFPDVESECAQGVCSGGCPGRCELPNPPIAEGQPCALGACAPGFDCRVVNDVRYACVRIAGKGELCGPTAQCSDGLYCSGGKCAAQIALGVACQRDFECGSGQVCRYLAGYATTVCVKELALGQSCGQGLSACTEGSYCAPTQNASTCHAVAQVGAACDTAQCALGLQCASGAAAAPTAPRVCEDVGALGHACTSQTCAWPLVCLSGACAPGRGAGAACQSSTDCAPDLYCAGDHSCRKQGEPNQRCDPSLFNSCNSATGECVGLPTPTGTLYECSAGCPGPGVNWPYDPTGDAGVSADGG
jgi:hypothetical protein